MDYRRLEVDLVLKFLNFKVMLDSEDRQRMRKKHSKILCDTDPGMREFLIEGYRRMTPRQKLRQVDELTKTVQSMALARIRKQYPHCTEREQRLRLAALWLDRETMLRVFNWDPEKEGR